MAAAPLKLLRRYLLDKNAVFYDAVGRYDLRQLVEQVARYQKRNALFLIKRQNNVSDLFYSGRIKAVYRLIEHEKFRMAEQGNAYGKALLHAERKLAGFFPAHAFQPYKVENILKLVGIGAGEYREAAQVFKCSAVFVYARILKQRADAVTGLIHALFAAEQLNTAARRHCRAQNKAHECCFAGAVFSDKAVELTFFDLHAYIFDGRFFAKLLGQILCTQNIFQIIRLRVN